MEFPKIKPLNWKSVGPFGSLTFSLPIAIRNAPGQASHLFVVQRNSGIERVNLAQNTRGTFLNLAAHLNTTNSPQRRLATNSENGILSMAFHPDYKQNGFFYVFYSMTLTSSQLEETSLRSVCRRFSTARSWSKPAPV